MPTQRREDKRVEERTSAWERERGVGAGVVRKRQSGRDRKKEKEVLDACILVKPSGDFRTAKEKGRQARLLGWRT